MFLGKDGFVWWIGVVEDIDDDLLLGRAKVRIFGYHPDYASGRLDTSDLPWAYTIMPTNIPNAYARSELGDWVFGFFLDADEAEEPAILGYLPGIPSGAGSFGRYKKERRNFYNTAANTANSFSITTRSGHTLDFQDTPGLESISLKHPKGPSIILDNAGQTGQIKLNVANTSTFNTSSITIGSQFLELNGSQYLNIQRGSSSIQMFANGNIQLSAPLGDIIVSGTGGSYGITQKFFNLDQINASQNTQIDFTQSTANSAVLRLNNPTFGSSNGFTAIVDI